MVPCLAKIIALEKKINTIFYSSTQISTDNFCGIMDKNTRAGKVFI